MAPKPPDEPRETPPSGEARAPQRPEDRRTPAEPAADPLDFGTFVSRSVRSSAERLRQSGEPGQREPAVPEDGGTATTSRSRRERPSRYWRDSIAGADPTSSRRSRRDDAPGEVRHDDDGDDGAQPPFWASLMNGGEDGGPNRRLIAALVAGLLVLLLLAFLLTRLIGGGDNGEEDPTPTPTAGTTEIVPSGGDAPASTPRTFPSGGQTDTPEPTPTEEILQGGDNQLGGQDDTEPEGTPGASGPPNSTRAYAGGTGDRPSLSYAVGFAV